LEFKKSCQEKASRAAGRKLFQGNFLVALGQKFHVPLELLLGGDKGVRLFHVQRILSREDQECCNPGKR
jgi:hypothetical protein